MCTAYEIGPKANSLPSMVKSMVAEALRSFGEMRIVRPTLPAPVIMPDGGLQEMSWGFRRKFAGKKGPISITVVNTRADKLDTAMWKEAFRERRCLIPAVGFYEWVEGAGGKPFPLRFTREDDGWIMIAGIWEEGASGRCFSMLTTEPSACVEGIHDRMPAVLADQQIDQFLEGNLHEFVPSSVPLHHVPVANFLKLPKPSPSDSDQPTLFD